jgi:hypothetical protein
MPDTAARKPKLPLTEYYTMKVCLSSQLYRLYGIHVKWVMNGLG